MNTYQYQLKRASGEVVAGVLRAENQALATQQVRSLGGTLLDIVRVGAKRPAAAASPT